MLFGKIDVETPPFNPVQLAGRPLPDGVALRQYRPQVLAQVRMGEDNGAFRVLANYIGAFGTPSNAAASPIAMTAPVVSSGKSVPIAMTAPVLSQQSNTMAFVLPEKFTAETAPRPTDPRVEIVTAPARLVAVQSFSGSTTVAASQARAGQFRKTLADSGFRVKGDWQLARYNPPFTLPFLRTNELWWEVENI